MKQRYNRAPKESQPFYHSAKWKRLRKAALYRDRGLCQDCMARFDAGTGFKPRRADTVHHLLTLEERPDLALDLNNLLSLCAICHNQRHPEKGESKELDSPAPPMRVIKI